MASLAATPLPEAPTSTVPSIEVLSLSALPAGRRGFDARPAPVGTRYVTATGTRYEITQLGAIRRAGADDGQLIEGRPMVVRSNEGRHLVVLGVDSSGRFLRSSTIVSEDPPRRRWYRR